MWDAVNVNQGSRGGKGERELLVSNFLIKQVEHMRVGCERGGKGGG